MHFCLYCFLLNNDWQSERAIQEKETDGKQEDLENSEDGEQEMRQRGEIREGEIHRE